MKEGVQLGCKFHHRIILLAEYLRHIIPCDQSDHQGYSKDHSHIEKIADDTHRIVVFAHAYSPSPLFSDSVKSLIQDNL